MVHIPILGWSKEKERTGSLYWSNSDGKDKFEMIIIETAANFGQFKRGTGKGFALDYSNDQDYFMTTALFFN